MLLAQFVAAEPSSALARMVDPWNQLYADSKAVASAVLFLHLVPLLIAGGTALTADRGTIRVVRASADDRARHLADLARTHAVVLGGLAMSFASGVLLGLSDVDEFLGSPVLWVKMGLIGLLLLNGFLMNRTERALSTGGNEFALWARLRAMSVLSLVLWIATTLAGVLLTNYA